MIAEVRRRRPALDLSVSWTTRARRPGETDGREYRFVSEDEFGAAVEAGSFVEWEEYRGARYGTPWSEVERALREGRDLLLEIDVRGARSVKERFPRAITIFIAPPSFASLEERLRRRGTDTEEQIRARLAAAEEEMLSRGWFDATVPNADVLEAAEQVLAILDGPPSGGQRPTDDEVGT